MATRRYAFLRFRADVDWRDVNPTLLLRVNRLGMALHKIITIVSGARGVPGHANMGASGSHHVPSNNPSGMGEAVDAYIGDKPLASVVKEKTLAKYGLYSGNRPGFYQGKPDPEHIETLERRTGKGPTGSPPEAPPGAGAQEPQPGPPADASTTMPDVQPASIPATSPSPYETAPGAAPPGAIGAEGSPQQSDPIETWRWLASQPLASEETKLAASRLGG